MGADAIQSLLDEWRVHERAIAEIRAKIAREVDAPDTTPSAPTVAPGRPVVETTKMDLTLLALATSGGEASRPALAQRLAEDSEEGKKHLSSRLRHMKARGLVENGVRGIWSLTDKGRVTAEKVQKEGSP